MPGITPVFNLPFEAPGDEPGHTLDGGEFGLDPILAEAVEAALLGLAASINTHTAQLAAVEQRLDDLEDGTSMVGWVPIVSGTSGAVASFDLDITAGGKFPVGHFALLRLHMRFDLSGTGVVNIRINNDSGTGDPYYFGMRATDFANAGESGVDILNHASQTSWRVGYGATVSTNNLICEIFHTNAATLHNFQATSARMSQGSATTQAQATAVGALASNLSATPTSLRLLAFTTAGVAISFAQAWYWLEGYRVPA